MAHSPTDTRALVFANGDLNDGPAVQAALAAAPDGLVIAADGGARLALDCGRVPDVLVGDLDSLSDDEVQDLRVLGATIRRFSAHKDETDLELALLEAVDQQAAWIRVIGAVGGRVDHMLANLYLLLLPGLAGRDVRLVSGAQSLWLVAPGTHTLHGAAGDTVSLLPLVPGVEGVTTGGLAYPLRDEPLLFGPARGVSNVMQESTARVTLRAGQLLVVHTSGPAE